MADNSIALGIKPFTAPDPGAVQANAINRISALATLQNAQLQRRQTMAAQSAYNEAGLDPNGNVNYMALKQGLLKRGLGSLVPDVVKAEQAAKSGDLANQTAAAGVTTAQLKNAADFQTQLAQNVAGQTSPQAMTAFAESMRKLHPELSGNIDQFMAGMPTDPDQYHAWQQNRVATALTAAQQLSKKLTTIDQGNKQTLISTNEFGDQHPQVVGTYEKGLSPDTKYQVDNQPQQIVQDATGTYALPRPGTGAPGGQVKTDQNGNVYVGTTPLAPGQTRTMGWTPVGNENTRQQVDNKMAIIANKAGVAPDAPLTKQQFLALNMTALEGTPAGRNNLGNMKNTDGSFRSFDSPQQYQAAQVAWLNRRWNEGARTIRDAVEGRVVGGQGAPQGQAPVLTAIGGKDKQTAAIDPKTSEKLRNQLDSAQMGLDTIQQIRSSFDELHRMNALPGDNGGIIGNTFAYLGRTGVGQYMGEQFGTDAAQKRLEVQKNLTALQNALIQSIPAGATRTKFMQEIEAKGRPDPFKMSYKTAQDVLDQYERRFNKAIADTNAQLQGGGQTQVASAAPAASGGNGGWGKATIVGN